MLVDAGVIVAGGEDGVGVGEGGGGLGVWVDELVGLGGVVQAIVL